MKLGGEYTEMKGVDMVDTSGRWLERRAARRLLWLFILGVSYSAVVRCTAL